MTNQTSDRQNEESTTKGAPKGTDQKSIMLIGLMGSGKTVIGKMLANVMNWPFQDSDKLIEGESGLRITDIFDLYGEEKFREMERRIILAEITKPGHILSVGGGAFCQKQIQQAAKSEIITIWLRAKPETLLGRMDNLSTRPLLAGPDPLGVLSSLHEQRYEDYQKADIIVDTDGLSQKQSLDKVFDAFTAYQSAQ